jgi:hypothetical protein
VRGGAGMAKEVLHKVSNWQQKCKKKPILFPAVHVSSVANTSTKDAYVILVLKQIQIT